MSHQNRDYAVTHKELESIGKRFNIGADVARLYVEKLAIQVGRGNIEGGKTANKMKAVIDDWFELCGFNHANM